MNTPKPLLRSHRKTACWLTCAAMVLLSGWAANAADAASLVINEFLAVNDGVLADADDEFPDWIEIHNPGTNPAPLLNWSLTDDPAQPRKWVFPDVLLPAQGYLVVRVRGPDFNAGAKTILPDLIALSSISPGWIVDNIQVTAHNSRSPG